MSEFEPPEDELDFGDIGSALSAIEAEGPKMLAPGDRIGGGRFIVHEHIGQGAVGEVWRVEDDMLKRDLAVKIVRIQDRVSVAERDELTTRVMREAIAARDASERCAHIVQVFDVASLPSGDPFIVMEFLDGATLRDWLSLCAPIDDPELVVGIGIQLCTALQALHRRGFIHRDVKPDNIFALDDEDGDPTPFIKLIDFGLAKDLEAGKLTRTAASIGTQRYMAPEQYFATGATPRSDIFSLGVILFEALTGRNPLPVATNELVAAYRNGMPRVEEHAPVPAKLASLVNACLSSAPDQRPTAKELLKALQQDPLGVSAQSGSQAPSLQPLPELPELPQLPEPPMSLTSDDILEVRGGVDVHDEAEQLTDLPALPVHDDARTDHTELPEPAEEQIEAVAAKSDQLPALPSRDDGGLVALPAQPPKNEPLIPESSPALLSKPFIEEEPSRRYSQRPPARSNSGLAPAVFAGMALIAVAIFWTSSGPQPSNEEPAPPAMPSSRPELAFKPRGPVDQDDFPRRPKEPQPLATSTQPPAVAPATSISTAPLTAAPVTTAAPNRPGKKTGQSKPVVRRAKKRPRKGLSNKLAVLAEAARTGEQPALAAPQSQAQPNFEGVKFADDSVGAQLAVNRRAKSSKGSAQHLPEATSLKAALVTGISSAAHGVVLARLTADVTVNGKRILRKGDIVKGRSRNNFERIFITFTSAKNGAIAFVGNAVTGGQPGLPAAKKRIPKEERGTNIVARGALRTAGSVADALGGKGVAGELAENVANEGSRDVRADFQNREPFVLTVAKGARFDIIVTGGAK